MLEGVCTILVNRCHIAPEGVRGKLRGIFPKYIRLAGFFVFLND